MIVDKTYLFQDKWLKKLPEFFQKLLTCHVCTGFWIGILLGLLIMEHKFSIIFGCGCASSLISSFSSNLINYLQIKSIINLKE